MVSKSHSVPFFSKSKMLFTESWSERLPPKVVLGSFHFFISGLKSKSPRKILVGVFSFKLTDEGNCNRIKKAFQNKLNSKGDQ